MQLKDRANKNEREFSKISEDNRQLTQKYNELLTVFIIKLSLVTIYREISKNSYILWLKN